MSKPDQSFWKVSQKFVWNTKTNQTGNITVLFAIFLPIILGFFLLVIDGGLLQIRKAELNTVAHSAAEYGLSKVADKIVELAEVHCHEGCPSEDPKSYLDQDDLRLLTRNSFALEINNSVRNFITNDSKTSSLSSENIIIEYPYNFIEPRDDLRLRISLSDSVDLVLEKVFGLTTNTIDIQSLVKISL